MELRHIFPEIPPERWEQQRLLELHSGLAMETALDRPHLCAGVRAAALAAAAEATVPAMAATLRRELLRCGSGDDFSEELVLLQDIGEEADPAAWRRMLLQIAERLEEKT
jgi:hypothetical protein